MPTVAEPVTGGVRIEENRIQALFDVAQDCEPSHVRAVLDKARQLEGLHESDVAVLMSVTDSTLLQELYDTGRYIKDEIYGSRLVLFAPLYVSNYCANECSYCASRCRNTKINRRALTQEEIAREVRALIDQGCWWWRARRIPRERGWITSSTRFTRSTPPSTPRGKSGA
jgi:2-iminoacetate synthase